MKREQVDKSIIIVGIGASAGGLEALQNFLLNLPAERGNIAYVVVQHLSPKHKSMMVELLARETPFDVLEIVNGMAPKANTVYITPPDRDVFLEKKLFKLKKPPVKWVGPKPSVDKFFISLAQEMNDKSVGVILSGTGSDGSQGIRAIRAEGGITIAQKPDEAKYDGMPLSSIQTKSIDYILSVSDIAQEVIHLLRYPKSLRVDKAENDELYHIFEILKDYIGTDFSLYKKSTITRRIERRMAAIKSIDLNEYIEYLRSNSGEIELLYKDMLIGVTSFFRDGTPFEDLAKEIQKYLDEHPNMDTFRVWAPACASGEEAYSLAITLDEILVNHKSVHVKIFATDIDEDSVIKARRGLFPEVSVTGISEERLKRYFIQRGNEFEVKPILKERVIFSRHDITIDPPFVNLDLVVCRNMLIYFENELQKRIFTTFAYSLHPRAILFLGKSETVGPHTDLFETTSQQSKLYITRTTTESRKALYPQLANPSKYLKPSSTIKKRHSGNMEEAIKGTLFEHYENKCIVVDNNFNIHYIKGNLNDLLTLPSGEINNNILKMLPDSLSLEIRSLIYKINKGEHTFEFPVETERIDEQRLINIKITPLEGYAGNYQYFLLCFEITPYKSANQEMQKEDGTDYSEDIKHLEQELMATREHLQTVVEELETSNEELQSSNEELQASNEELQASNEELETTNEELQSTNEELQTAYAEIRALYEKQNIQNSNLEDRTQQLVHVKEELDIQYNYLKEILDTEKNIVVVTDGHNITSTNQSFLNFFDQYKNIDEFKKEHACICEFFEKIDEENFIYDKKGGINWLQLILHTNRSDLKVKMIKDSKTFTYHIMANELNGEGNIFVVTLTDITDIEVARENMSKALSDEIRSNLSSSKILYNAHNILGIDMFVQNVYNHIKSPLNKMNQYYHQLHESIDNDESSNEYEFRQEKEIILENLNCLRNYFTQKEGQKINVYNNIEQFALMLRSKKSPLSIEVMGSHNVELHDTQGHFSTLTLLWLSIFINILEDSVETLKVEVQKERDNISIVIRAVSSNKLFTKLLSCQSDKVKVEDRDENLYNALQTLVSFLHDMYYGDLIVSPESCKISIG